MTSGGGFLTIVKRDGSIGQSHRIGEGSNVVGSAPSCSIRILQNDKKEFAARQFLLTVHPTETIIKNLSHETPTYVNDDPFETKVLIHGDLITFGSITFRWEYFNMGKSNLPVKVQKGSTKRTGAKHKTNRKSEPFIKNKVTELKRRNSLSDLSAPFVSYNRQVAVVKPQRRQFELSNEAEEALEVPVFSTPDNRIRTHSASTGRRQSKRASALSSQAHFENVSKKRKSNEVKKIDTPVIPDDHKKAALLMLTRTPGNRATPTKPAALQTPVTEKQPSAKPAAKKFGSLSKTQSKAKTPSGIARATKTVASAPPKSSINKATRSAIPARKALLAKYPLISRNSTPKPAPSKQTPQPAPRVSILKTSSTVSNSPRRSVVFASIPETPKTVPVTPAEVKTPTSARPRGRPSKGSAQTPKTPTAVAKTRSESKLALKTPSPKNISLKKSIGPKTPDVVSSPASRSTRSSPVLLKTETPKQAAKKSISKISADRKSRSSLSKTPAKQSSPSPKSSGSVRLSASRIASQKNTPLKAKTPKSAKSTPKITGRKSRSSLTKTPSKIESTPEKRSPSSKSPKSKDSDNEMVTPKTILTETVITQPRSPRSASASKSTPPSKINQTFEITTPLNRSLRNSSLQSLSIVATPKSTNKAVSKLLSQSRRSSLKTLASKSIRKSVPNSPRGRLSTSEINNIFDMSEGGKSPSFVAATPISKNKTLETSNSSPKSRRSTSARQSDSILNLSPISSPKRVSSPKTPRSSAGASINTTPELSKLFDLEDLEASTPKLSDKSRSPKDLSPSPTITRRGRTSILSKTEPRKATSRSAFNKSRKSLNLARRSSTRGQQKTDVTPKSLFKLKPEILKEKHSTAKKSISKKFIIESRSVRKDVFSSPLRRKLSQTLQITSMSLADDVQENSIINASFELLYGSSLNDSRKQSLSAKKLPVKLNTPVKSPQNRTSRSQASPRSLAKSPNKDESNISGVELLFATPEKNTSSVENRSLRRSVSKDVNTSVQSNKALRSPKAVRANRSPKNDLSNVSGVKRLLRTPRADKGPKNDLSNVSGVKRLMKTPKATKSPKNDLRNVSGVKRLLKTPKPAKSPKNDLTNVSGVKKLLKTPKVPKSPKNDLTNVSGVKRLMKTPKANKSPKNDLTNVAGVKRLLTTPKPVKSPKNDLTNVAGVKKLLRTPKVEKSPKNDLTNVSGVKRLMKTPKPTKSPKNDLSNVSGVKRLLKTPKVAKSPKNDLRNVSGVKRLLKTPRAAKSPKNDLSNVSGVKKLLKTPKPVKSPKNDLSNVSGVKNLLRTPRVAKSPKNDLSNVSGVKKLLKTPKIVKTPILSGVKRLLKTPKSKAKTPTKSTSPKSKTSPALSATKKLQKAKKTLSLSPLKKSPTKSPVNRSPSKSPAKSSRKALPTVNTSAFYKKSVNQNNSTDISIFGQSTPAKGKVGSITNMSLKKLSPIKAISPSPVKARVLRKGAAAIAKKKSPIKKAKVTKKIKKELIEAAVAPALSPPAVSKKSSLKVDPENSLIVVRGRRGKNNIPLIAVSPSPSKKNEKKVTFASEVSTRSYKPSNKTRTSSRQAGISAPSVKATKKASIAKSTKVKKAESPKKTAASPKKPTEISKKTAKTKVASPKKIAQAKAVSKRNASTKAASPKKNESPKTTRNAKRKIESMIEKSPKPKRAKASEKPAEKVARKSKKDTKKRTSASSSPDSKLKKVSEKSKGIKKVTKAPKKSLKDETAVKPKKGTKASPVKRTLRSRAK